METIVWWSAGGGSLNKEAKRKPLYGGAQWGESLNKETEWRPLYGGAEGGASFIKEVKRRPLYMVERKRRKCN